MDTNVAVVANGKAEQAGAQCVDICIDALEQIQESRRLLLDDLGLVLDEYIHNLSPPGQSGPGSMFLLWLLRNQYNELRCRIVHGGSQ